MQEFNSIGKENLVNLNGTYCTLEDITAFKSQPMETIDGRTLKHTVIFLNSVKELFIEDDNERILKFLIEHKNPVNIINKKEE